MSVISKWGGENNILVSMLRIGAGSDHIDLLFDLNQQLFIIGDEKVSGDAEN